MLFMCFHLFVSLVLKVIQSHSPTSPNLGARLAVQAGFSQIFRDVLLTLNIR